jgi:hypothetical protein
VDLGGHSDDSRARQKTSEFLAMSYIKPYLGTAAVVVVVFVLLKIVKNYVPATLQTYLPS